MEAVRALVLAGEERSSADSSLARAMGAERARAVGALLLRRARDWAQAGFGAGAVEVVQERSAVAALRARRLQVGGGAGSGAGAGESAAGAAEGDRGGAAGVIVISPELPAWHPELAEAVLADLRTGCRLSLAPVFDGGLYLLAVAPDPGGEVVDAVTELDLAGPHGMGSLMGLASRSGWEVGLLRAERALRRERDVEALRADPLTDRELRALLEGWGEGT